MVQPGGPAAPGPGPGLGPGPGPPSGRHVPVPVPPEQQVPGGRGLLSAWASNLHRSYKEEPRSEPDNDPTLCTLRRTEPRTKTRNMYSRSNSVTLTVQRERFGFSGASSRSTEPEVFTFERAAPQASAVLSYAPVRPRRRCTRVMYPAKVRMHLPPPERSPAQRWLLVLCLVVLWQIYTEEPCADAPLAGADSPTAGCPVADCDYPGFPFHHLAAEDQQLADLGTGSDLLSAGPTI